jgi:hypothetical protein
MVFTNPWGLLALLSIPAILGLHFFRSHRQTRVIGGLHLWRFAAIRQPIGSRWTRLQRSLSLLLQLLAALLLSLLIAGLEFPREQRAPHYTIILDDSVSMSARHAGGPMERAQRLLEEWSDDESRYTVVAAGARAQILVGPYATRAEMLRRLPSWRPRALSCDLARAIQLAAPFLQGDQKMLLLTDHPEQAEEYAELLEVCGVGEPLANNAIVFADRIRITPDQDRVFVTLRTWGSEPATCQIKASLDGQTVYESAPPRELVPDSPDSLSFDIRQLTAPVEITLGPDALAADNKVVLSPVSVRTIQVHAESLEPMQRFLVRAVEAAPFARMEPDPEQSDIVFALTDAFPTEPGTTSTVGSPAPNGAEPGGPQVVAPQKLLDKYASAALICALPDPAHAPPAGVARGLDMLADSESLITQGLPLEEGILWPFTAMAVPRSYVPVLTAADNPLLFGGLVTSGRAARRELYYLNLLADRTNIYQTSAWPVLISNMIEHARSIVPGMSRTNYRMGEQIQVSIDPRQLDEESRIRLLREGQPYETFDGIEQVPRVLDELDVGTYQLVESDSRTLAAFSVNLFAPAESDLTGANEVAADFASLEPGHTVRETGDDRIRLTLYLLVILLTGLSWISQDTSR